jgi:hypothetical protein
MKTISIAFCHPGDAVTARQILIEFGDASKIIEVSANQLAADIPDALEGNVRSAVHAVTAQSDTSCGMHVR